MSALVELIYLCGKDLISNGVAQNADPDQQEASLERLVFAKETLVAFHQDRNRVAFLQLQCF